MKRITIVGIGAGRGTVTPEAREAVARAEVLFGSPRALEQFKDTSKPAYPFYLPGDIAPLVRESAAGELAVLVSGDVGFYSAAAGLAGALEGCELRFIPGVSSVNAFFARLGLPWQDAAFVSAHGRGMNVVDAVRRNRLTFCLTGNNASGLGAALRAAGFGDIQTHVGENLGMETERVHAALAGDLADMPLPPLTVLLFQNPDFDDSAPTGLPDSRFLRLPGIPMTKSETRALVMSKLGICPSSVCWDVGAGSGSVTVEMALGAYRGRVCAVERRGDAIPLIRQNCARFHLGNVDVYCGEAPGALWELIAPDAVFIGGSGGRIGEIIGAALSKNPKARIAVAAVTLETSALALAALSDAGLCPEITQQSVARGKMAGGLHLMEAQNPITLLCAGGEL